MAKDLVPIGIGIATIGWEPTKGKVFSIGAFGMASKEFSVNIQIPTEEIEKDPYWKRHLEQLPGLVKNPEPRRRALLKFAQWLKDFNGQILPIYRGMDLWWLHKEFYEELGKCPFGTEGIDLRSWIAGRRRQIWNPVVGKKGSPLEIAKARYHYMLGAGLSERGEKEITQPDTQPVQAEQLQGLESVSLNIRQLRNAVNAMGLQQATLEWNPSTQVPFEANALQPSLLRGSNR